MAPTTSTTNTNSATRPIRNDIPYKRERLGRILVQHRNGSTSVGTGFFVDAQGELLTCFHVISGTELCNLRAMNTNITGTPDEEHIQLQNYLTQSVVNIQVELMDGSRKIANLVKFNHIYDVASLKIAEENSGGGGASGGSGSGAGAGAENPFFELDTDYMPEYDESTFFCGFQLTGGYSDATQYPFSINRAVVSAFPEVVVAGDKYQHIQLNSINLGGNSGAPLFVEGSNKVIGIINGNMNWGKDNFTIMDKSLMNKNPDGTESGALRLAQEAVRVPLCIAYATPLNLIKSKTDFLNN